MYYKWLYQQSHLSRNQLHIIRWGQALLEEHDERGVTYFNIIVLVGRV
jgi:hypothetical protein